jgi:two-component sensor histidine kinase
MVPFFLMPAKAQQQESDSLNYIKYRNLAAESRNTGKNNLLHYDSLQTEFAKRTGSNDLYVAAFSEYIRDLATHRKITEAKVVLTELKSVVNLSNNPVLQYEMYFADGHIAYRELKFKAAGTIFKQALSISIALQDEDRIATSKLWIGGSAASYGKPDSSVNYIFEAIDYFKKKKNHANLTLAYNFLAYGYLRNGNLEDASRNYSLATESARNAGDKVSESSSILGEAFVRLGQNRLSVADTLISKGHQISTTLAFQQGIAQALSLRGNYYTRLGKTDTAEIYFDSADVLIRRHNLNYAAIVNSGLRMQNQLRAGNFKQADSLANLTAKTMKEKLPGELKASIVDQAQANGAFNSDQAKAFKSFLLKNVGAENLPPINLFTGMTTNFDSAYTMVFNKQLLDIETKYKTRLTTDSLRIQQQQLLISNQQLSNRNIMLISAAIMILLVATTAFLQYTSRKRTERNKKEIEKAKDQIEFLTREMHHQIKNNMGIISRFVEVTEKDGGGPAAISSLRSRVNAIHSLHTILYENDLSREVNLRHYIDKLIPSLKKLYTMSFKLEYEVPADVHVPTDTANKLGLILTELCTNSYKYAFDNVSNPEVHFSFTAADDKWKFQYGDNGHGLPPQLKDSYGMKLIKGLSSQLNGEYRIYNNPGLHFELLIPNLQPV